MGGIINNPPFQDTFNHPSDSLLGTIVAIYEIGCCVGALITAVIGERLGRRKSILVGAVLMLGGAGFQAGVSSAGAMIGARIVSGLGMVGDSLWTRPLSAGIHQLDRPSSAVRGVPGPGSWTLCLLPALSAQPRHLHRLLGRIRLHSHDRIQGLAYSRRSPGNLHHPHARSRLHRARVAPMAGLARTRRGVARRNRADSKQARHPPRRAHPAQGNSRRSRAGAIHRIRYLERPAQGRQDLLASTTAHRLLHSVLPASGRNQRDHLLRRQLLLPR